MLSKNTPALRTITKIASMTGLLGVATLLSATAQAQSLKSWHETMRHTAPTEAGCFQTSYPSTSWKKTTCGMTNYRSEPRVNPSMMTVGNGNDYAAQTTNVTTSATGSFPVVTGVTSETDGTTANSYTLQLNTNTANGSPACASYGYSSCQVWEQFIYSSAYAGGTPQVFIQNWMFIPRHARCPGGWNHYSTSSYNGCYKNSSAVNVTQVPASQLGNLKLSGSVSKGGNDTVTFVNGTTAYAMSQPDTTLGMAYVWKQSEYNIVGNGGGSAATFNTGSSITVNLQVNDGTTNAPSCLANAGSTGETNNLNLGSCSTAGGTAPYIQFTESN